MVFTAVVYYIMHAKGSNSLTLAALGVAIVTSLCGHNCCPGAKVCQAISCTDPDLSIITLMYVYHSL